VVRGKKLIGSAMRSHGGAILQHGAILLEWDSRLQAGSMGLADDSGLRPHITTLHDELASPPDRTDLEEAVVDGFSSTMGVRFERAPLSRLERDRQSELSPSFAIEA
jgi:lipoate-protein ligase A